MKSHVTNTNLTTALNRVPDDERDEPVLGVGVDERAEEGDDEADEHAHLLADAVLDLVEVLRHLAGKVRGRVGVVPPDVLAEHRP